ncbi:hypothetical protein E5D57_011634 [Metarhizium anisopliae]|nr:hypothetical protein E5D57_011634 [Metarhizium anisopliae]
MAPNAVVVQAPAAYARLHVRLRRLPPGTYLSTDFEQQTGMVAISYFVHLHHSTNVKPQQKVGWGSGMAFLVPGFNASMEVETTATIAWSWNIHYWSIEGKQIGQPHMDW